MDIKLSADTQQWRFHIKKSLKKDLEKYSRFGAKAIEKVGIVKQELSELHNNTQWKPKVKKSYHEY